MMSQKNWFDNENPIYGVGLLIYLALIVFFAFFYLPITFNAAEVSDNILSLIHIFGQMKQERRQNGRCNRVVRLKKPDGLLEASDFSHCFFTFLVVFFSPSFFVVYTI